jgi:hypothetical protein
MNFNTTVVAMNNTITPILEVEIAGPPLPPLPDEILFVRYETAQTWRRGRLALLRLYVRLDARMVRIQSRNLFIKRNTLLFRIKRFTRAIYDIVFDCEKLRLQSCTPSDSILGLPVSEYLRRSIYRFMKHR